MTTSTVSTSGVQGSAARPFGQLWQVPAFLIGAIALGLVAAAAPLAPHGDDTPFDQDLLTVRRALEKPGVLPEDVVALAESTVARASRQPERAGEAHFLLGAVYLRQAERHTAPDKKREERDKAGMHLELAELRGVPEADVARLTYLRGKAAFLVAGNMPRAIELLSKSLPGGAIHPAEGYSMLVQAYLQSTPPDIDAALSANLKHMEFIDDEITIAQSRLQRGELLLKKGQRAEAINILEAIGSKSPQDIRLQARLLQATAAMQEGLWGQAIGWWSELLPNPQIVAGGKGRILYNIGICCARFEPPYHEKDAIAAWREAQLYGNEEAQAAALRLAELRLYSGGDSDATLSHFKEALDKVATPAEYKNSLIDLAKVRELLEEACRIFDEQRDSEHFLQAAELYKKVALAGAADEKVGAAAMAQGMQLLKGPDIEKARTRLLQAALAYQRAADSRTPADSANALWHAIECFRAAEKWIDAVAVLKKFVDLPTPPERKAEAWFVLAEIQRGLNHPDAADSYKHCVAFHSPNYWARALLQLADIAVAMQNLDDAQETLKQIKSQPPPIVDRDAHHLALVKLANLYFQRKQYEKAALECKEIVNQYPAFENLFVVREQLGQCYLKLANQANDSMRAEDISAAKKQYDWKEWQKYLDLARIVFQDLADDLNAKADELGRQPGGKRLPQAEEALRRKAHFLVAECHFDLVNGLHDAFVRYHMLFEEFRRDPDALWACRGLCNCLTAALKAERKDIDLFREAAEDAVQCCLEHFEEFDRAGAFTTQTDKTEWFNWLKTTRDYLKRTKGRAG